MFVGNCGQKCSWVGQGLVVRVFGVYIVHSDGYEEKFWLR